MKKKGFLPNLMFHTFHVSQVETLSKASRGIFSTTMALFYSVAVERSWLDFGLLWQAHQPKKKTRPRPFPCKRGRNPLLNTRSKCARWHPKDLFTRKLWRVSLALIKIGAVASTHSLMDKSIERSTTPSNLLRWLTIFQCPAPPLFALTQMGYCKTH